MKKTLGAGAACLLAFQVSFAQTVGFAGRGSSRGAHSGRFGSRPGSGFHGRGPLFFPSGFPMMDWGDYPRNQAAPVVLVLQAPEFMPRQFVEESYKPETAKPVIHEYKPAASNAPGETPAAFSIALRNGSIHSAQAVWVEGGQLHYVSAEGTSQRASLESIDRATTSRLNRQKNLEFWLPPGAAAAQ